MLGGTELALFASTTLRDNVVVYVQPPGAGDLDGDPIESLMR
jgi:hypothetical protein